MTEFENLTASDIVIRYDLYEKRAPVNISTGAKTMSFDQLVKHLGLDEDAEAALYRRMTGHALSQTKALEAYMATESKFKDYPHRPFCDGSYITPDFTGCDIIDMGDESVGIEINDGHSGGMWYLEGGRPIDDLVQLMVRRAKKFKETIREVRRLDTSVFNIMPDPSQRGLYRQVTHDIDGPEVVLSGVDSYVANLDTAVGQVFAGTSPDEILLIGVGTAAEAYVKKDLRKALEAVATLRLAKERAGQDFSLRLNSTLNLGAACYIRDMLSGGDFEEGKSEIREAVQNFDPGDARNIGCVLMDQGAQLGNPFYLINGFLVLTRVIELIPQDPEAWLNLGTVYSLMVQLLEDEEFLPRAEHCLRMAEDLFPEDDKEHLFEVYSNLAGVYTQNGNDVDGARAYQKAIECLPFTDYGEKGEVTMNIGYATCLNRSGKHEEAIEILNKVRAINPDKSAIYLQLGSAYYELERYDEAIVVADAGLRLDPKNVEIRLQMARAYFSKGDLKKAAEFLNESRDMMPESAELCLAFAEFAEHIGDYELAINYANKAKILDPDNARPYHIVGQCYLEHLDNMWKATEELQIAAELDPENAEIHHNLGVAYFRNRHWDEAKKSIEKAIELEPDEPRFRLARGLVYFVNEEYDHAVDEFQKTRAELPALDPRSALTYFYEAWTERERGNLDKAESLLAKAEKLDTNAMDFPHLPVLTEKGRVLVEQGRYREALECFAAIRHMGDDNTASLSMGKIYHQLGNERLATERNQELARALSHKDSFTLKYRPSANGTGVNSRKEEKYVREFLNAIVFQAVQAKARGEDIIVAIDSGWIPHEQRFAIQGLLNKIGHLRQLGLDNVKVVRRDRALASSITIERNKLLDAGKSVPISNIVILGEKKVIDHKGFNKFRNPATPDDQAFFAGIVLPEEPLGTTDLKLLSMIKETLERAFGPGEERNHIFHLKADPVDIKDLKDRYDLRKRFITSAA